MPPLESAPGSFYAVRGSSEADELYEMARAGEFRVFAVEPDNYLLFSRIGDDPQMAAVAMCFEAGVEHPLYSNIEFDPLDPEKLDETLSLDVENPDNGTWLRKMLGKLTLR